MGARNLPIVSIAFDVCNIVLHGVGSTLLISIYKRGRKTCQQTYLVNLALAELMKNIFSLLLNIILVCMLSDDHLGDCLFKTWVCIHLFVSSGVAYLHVCSMIYVAADRLWYVIMHVRYYCYWDTMKARVLVLTSWVVTIFVSFACALLYYFHRDVLSDDTSMLITMHIPNGLFVFFILIAASTFVAVFRKIARSRKRELRKSGSSGKKLFWDVFRKSRFFLPVLLTGSYVILMVLPKLVISVFLYVGIGFPSWLSVYEFISTRLSDTVHALMYIILQEPTWRVLYETLCCCAFSKESYSISKQTSFTTLPDDTVLLKFEYSSNNESHSEDEMMTSV